jgi:dTDP-4-amino-4,6-dideoxygalactose transaminase
MIPCLDLKKQHQSVQKEVFEAFEQVYNDTAFSGGKYVEAFEKDFAAFCQTQYALGLNNGTSALHLAYLALGIGAGDEVIIPANTFIATVWGVSYCGATPVFVDCTADTWEIDVKAIEKAITPKTKAIAGVHLYGQPCDIDGILALCKKHNLYFVEDAAQAQGALYNGKPVGGFGDIACFSFYPGKNLGACGEAGGVTTNNAAYAEHMSKLRNHGCEVRYYHDIVGYNYRMGGLEGASLKIKLKYLPDWNARRQHIAERYFTEIKNSKITFQAKDPKAKSIYHLLVVTTPDKDALVKHLQENNIGPAFHYPVPCHLQKAYADLGYKQGDFPNAEYLASHCVSLPMFAELSDADVDHVIKVLNAF